MLRKSIKVNIVQKECKETLQLKNPMLNARIPVNSDFKKRCTKKCSEIIGFCLRASNT